MNSIVFQEQHTKGYLWWKRYYYKYYRYFEGSMMAVSVYPEETLKSIEKKMGG